MDPIQRIDPDGERTYRNYQGNQEFYQDPAVRAVHDLVVTGVEVGTAIRDRATFTERVV